MGTVTKKNKMKKIKGILITLIVIYVATAILGENFLGGYNQGKLLERTGLYGLLGIGVAFVIITGGMDLSIGSGGCSGVVPGGVFGGGFGGLFGGLRGSVAGDETRMVTG